MSKDTITQPIQWRVLEPNTLRAYMCAGRDFQLATGVQIDQATPELAIAWRISMERRGFSTNTIRQRLSALRTVTGLSIELPRRVKSEVRILNAEQVRAMLSHVSDRADRMLLVRLLTIGTLARTVTAPADSTFLSHLIGAEQEHRLATQKITRLLKRIANKANLNPKQVNLRVWCVSGRRLIETLTPAELASLLETRAHQDPGQVVGYAKALHGINRRSRVKA